MLLRELDLDLEYTKDEGRLKTIIEKNNCTIQEATVIDYNDNWKWKRRDFNNQTRCVSAMFERLLGKYKTDDCWKILISCVGDITDERVVNLDGVVTVQVSFNYREFINSNEQQQKEIALNLLMLGIRKVVTYMSLDINKFEEINKTIKSLNYYNEYTFNKPVKSPDKKHICKVVCQHEVNEYKVFIEISDKQGNMIKREHIITELPNEWNFVKHLGKVEWISNTKVVLKPRNGGTIPCVSI